MIGVKMSKDVHTEHCCAMHGCKYGDEFCSVWLGYKKQSYGYWDGYDETCPIPEISEEEFKKRRELVEEDTADKLPDTADKLYPNTTVRFKTKGRTQMSNDLKNAELYDIKKSVDFIENQIVNALNMNTLTCEHHVFLRRYWMSDVANDMTLLGYWPWVLNKTMNANDMALLCYKPSIPVN